MRRRLLYVASMPATLLLAACGLVGGSSTVEDTALSWAESFFNCDYRNALTLSTAESEKWLRFAASNTSEEALWLLQNEGGASAEVVGVQQVNDTTATCRLSVSRYLDPAAFGDSARVAADGTFDIELVLREKGWLVRMEGLPRSGRQSRD